MNIYQTIAMILVIVVSTIIGKLMSNCIQLNKQIKQGERRIQQIESEIEDLSKEIKNFKQTNKK